MASASSASIYCGLAGNDFICSARSNRHAAAEVLTKLPEEGVPDKIFERIHGHLSQKETSDLTFSIMLINAWNRINVGFKTVPGLSDAVLEELDKAGLS
jgi:alkylhydroperoxidase family enzyme